MNDMTTIGGGGATAAVATGVVPQSPLPLGMHHRRRSSRISFGSGLDLVACSSPALTAAWASRKQFVSQVDLAPNKAFAMTPLPSGQKQFPSNNDFSNGYSVGLPLTASAKEMCGNSSGNLVLPSTTNSRHNNNGSTQPPPPPPMQFPQLMLLTVSDPPKRPCELRVSIDDLGAVESSLGSAEHGSLDGVYLQYQPEMLTPSGAASVRAFAQNYSVGVWTHSGKDPDDYATFVHLTNEAGASFVNTDLPESFSGDVMPPKRSFGGGSGGRRALSGGGSSTMGSSTVG